MALDALIENAVAHTDAGDRIELSARLEGQTVVIAIEDSGSGILDSEIERFFDRFARADSHRSREAGGVGLGLAIVKTIAEAHLGSVRVRSTLSEGSVFELVLPVSAFSPAPHPEVRATQAHISASAGSSSQGQGSRLPHHKQ